MHFYRQKGPQKTGQYTLIKHAIFRSIGSRRKTELAACNTGLFMLLLGKSGMYSLVTQTLHYEHRE